MCLDGAGVGVPVEALVVDLVLHVLIGLHLAMHPLHVSRDMHLLLGAVRAIRALELRLLTALPLLVVPE